MDKQIQLSQSSIYLIKYSICLYFLLLYFLFRNLKIFETLDYFDENSMQSDPIIGSINGDSQPFVETLRITIKNHNMSNLEITEFQKGMDLNEIQFQQIQIHDNFSKFLGDGPIETILQGRFSTFQEHLYQILVQKHNQSLKINKLDNNSAFPTYEIENFNNEEVFQIILQNNVTTSVNQRFQILILDQKNVQLEQPFMYLIKQSTESNQLGDFPIDLIDFNFNSLLLSDSQFNNDIFIFGLVNPLFFIKNESQQLFIQKVKLNLGIIWNTFEKLSQVYSIDQQFQTIYLEQKVGLQQNLNQLLVFEQFNDQLFQQVSSNFYRFGRDLTKIINDYFFKPKNCIFICFLLIFNLLAIILLAMRLKEEEVQNDKKQSISFLHKLFFSGIFIINFFLITNDYQLVALIISSASLTMIILRTSIQQEKFVGILKQSIVLVIFIIFNYYVWSSKERISNQGNLTLDILLCLLLVFFIFQENNTTLFDFSGQEESVLRNYFTILCLIITLGIFDAYQQPEDQVNVFPIDILRNALNKSLILQFVPISVILIILVNYLKQLKAQIEIKAVQTIFSSNLVLLYLSLLFLNISLSIFLNRTNEVDEIDQNIRTLLFKTVPIVSLIVCILLNGLRFLIEKNLLKPENFSFQTQDRAILNVLEFLPLTIFIGNQSILPTLLISFPLLRNLRKKIQKNFTNSYFNQFFILFHFIFVSYLRICNSHRIIIQGLSISKIGLFGCNNNVAIPLINHFIYDIVWFAFIEFLILPEKEEQISGRRTLQMAEAHVFQHIQIKNNRISAQFKQKEYVIHVITYNFGMLISLLLNLISKGDDQYVYNIWYGMVYLQGFNLALWGVFGLITFW